MGVLKVWDGTQWVESAGATGDVVGPSSTTDNRVPQFDGTTGKLLKTSGMTISGGLVMSGVTVVDGVISKANIINRIRPLVALTYNDLGARTASIFLRIGNTSMGTAKGFVMPYSGNIRAHSVSVQITTATAGDVTFEVRIGNTNQSTLELEFLSSGGTGSKTDSVTVAAGVTFSAGDIMQVRAVETDTMAWDDVMGTVWVEFDP